MFVSGKPLSKFSCVCLPLRKLVNKKYFMVKEKFGLVSRKVFFLLAVFFSGKWFPENHFSNFLVFVYH